MESFIKKLKNEYIFIIEQEAREYNHMLHCHSISNKEQKSMTKYSYLYKQELLISKIYSISIEIINEFNKMKNCTFKPLPSLIYKRLLKYVKDDFLININDLSDDFFDAIKTLVENY